MKCNKCKEEMGHYCCSCGYVDEYFEAGICKDCYDPLRDKVKQWFGSLDPETKQMLYLIDELGCFNNLIE